MYKKGMPELLNDVYTKMLCGEYEEPKNALARQYYYLAITAVSQARNFALLAAEYEDKSPEANLPKEPEPEEVTPAKEDVVFVDFDDGCGTVQAHKHKNGGGLVADTATVEDAAYVGPNARVFGKAQVLGKAKVCDQASVCGNAQVFGNAWVYGNSFVSDSAKVYGDASVFDHAEVSGCARVFDTANIHEDAEVRDNANVCGEAKVHGKAVICGDSMITGEVT